MLASFGAVAIFADEVSRAVYEPGKAGHRAIVKAFGREVLDRDGRVDRKSLAARVFASDAERRKLEAAVWPVMAEAMRQKLAQAEADGAPAAVIEAAVLFEAGWDRLVDEVWTVTAPEGALIERVGARDGLTAEQVRARMKAQLPASEKEKRADRVIVNDGTLAHLRRQVEKAWREATR
jgi:dephospho-CoA kinase